MSAKGDYINTKTMSTAERKAYHVSVARLRSEGLNAPTIARQLRLNRSTVQDWVKRLDDAQGDPGVLQEAKRGPKTGTTTLLDATQQRVIQRLLIDKTPDQLKFNFALWTSQAVALAIRERFDIEMTDRSVRRYLASWGFTPQRPVRRAYEQSNAAVRKWREEEYPAIRERAKREKAEIHWCDETCAKACEYRPKGYAPKGKTPEFRPVANQGIKVNMISSVTNRGKVRFMLSGQAFNARLFKEFMKRLVRDTRGKVFLIVDNLRVHHAKCNQAWLKKNAKRIELFYLPSYSPDLNPVELLNNDLKSALHKGEPARCKGKLETKVRRHMRRRQREPKVVKNFFEKDSTSYAKEEDGTMSD